jgi:5-methylcytosine-specific restriction endonuclease McrA
MPIRGVDSIEDMIFYQYAKIIVKSAKKFDDGESAKKNDFGLIHNRFKDLKSGKIVWSDILREDMQFVESDKKCFYCGDVDSITKEHIVPRSFAINERCGTCDAIQSVHNIIWACKSCNSSKGTKGLYHYYQEKLSGDKKFYDHIPTLLEKKYLKTIYRCHQCNGTLKIKQENLTALDIDIDFKS